MLEHTIIDGVNAASSSSQGQPTLQPLRRHQNHYMEDTFMIFQVENVLFRVPTYLLSKESELFAGMFKLPQPGENTEGSSDSNPVVLPSELSSEDFGNLLEALYPLAFSLQCHLTTVKWISILKLSTKWYFVKLRAYAIVELERMNELSSIQKVQLGRSNKVSRWVIDGLQAYVEAKFPMTDQEAAELDLDYPTTAYRLFRIREKKLSPMKYNQPTVSIVCEIEGAFKEHLAGIRSDEEGFRGTDNEIPVRVPGNEEMEMREEKEREAREREEVIMNGLEEQARLRELETLRVRVLEEEEAKKKEGREKQEAMRKLRMLEEEAMLVVEEAEREEALVREELEFIRMLEEEEKKEEAMQEAMMREELEYTKMLEEEERQRKMTTFQWN